VLRTAVLCELSPLVFLLFTQYWCESAGVSPSCVVADWVYDDFGLCVKFTVAWIWNRVSI